jgi:LmbE family N-acetylglucosaminyl deacetylase
MGASVRKHLEAGHEVHTVLLTTGINSGARAATGLSRPAFSAARDDEFTRASRRLGVPFQRIHYSTVRVQDGQLTQEAAEDAMLAWLDVYGFDTWVKTYSDQPLTGRHSDHVTSGQAAMSLLEQGLITNLRLYVEPWLREDFASTHGLTLSVDTATGASVVKVACDEYNLHDSVGGKYGIGWLSVKTFFELVRADPRSFYHVPITS